MATNKWVGTTNTTWGTTPGAASSNWSLGTVPTSSDDVVFDGTSNTRSCVTSTGSTCLSLTITSGFTQTFTVTGATTVAGSLNYGTGSWTLAGTGIITVSASSTITTNARTLTHSLTFTGTLTITLAGTLTCQALAFSGGSPTFSGAFDISCTTMTSSTSSITCTLTGNINASGLINIAGSATTTTTFNGFNLNCSAGFTLGSGSVTGTTTIIMLGGTLTPSTGTGTIKNNLTFQGSVTIASANSLRYDTGTMTYSSGSITTTSTTLLITASATLATAGITWNNITISGTTTITLTSALVSTGTVTLSGSTTFVGAFNVTMTNLSSITAGLTHTLVFGQTYSVSSTLTLTGTSASHLTIRSSVGGSQVSFYVIAGGTSDVGFVNATDITSAAGITIWDYKGTLSNATNWSVLPAQMPTVVSTF